MAYAIYDRRMDRWIGGFDEEHQLVVLVHCERTSDSARVKRFAAIDGEGGVREWLQDHCDAGYGLQRVDVEVWNADAMELVEVKS